MPSLYERLTKPSDDSQKIAIHTFRELLHDFHRGNITAQQIIDELVLDTDQTEQATVLYQKSNLVTNKEEYFNRVFGYLVLAETGTLPDVYNETNFNAWINGIS